MNKYFEKHEFNLNNEFIFNHTFGISAENSTLGYLHDVHNFLVFYFMKGTGNIKIDGNSFDINEGDFIILNPSEMFCCRVDKNIYHERLTLHINESILKNFPDECSDLFAPFFNGEKKLCNKITKEDAIIYGIQKKMPEIHELTKNPTPENKLLSICKVIEFFTELNKISTSVNQSIPVSTNPVINDVLEYINGHFTENFNINFLAEKFNLNTSYLSHLFKEKVGIALWNYVIIKRINLFNVLISKGGSTEDACYKVGFQNYSNFFRLYKKHMNMTPLEFKQKQKNH